MEPRTPPKFVPTLTEVAAQALEEKSTLAPSQKALDATEDIADGVSASTGLDMLRRRRETNAGEQADAPSDLDIANLATQSGWAQVVDEAVLGALPVGSDTQVLPTLVDYVVDTESSVLVASAASTLAAHFDAAALQIPDSQPVTHVEGQVEAAPAASEAATASLVASAAKAAQALEEAITRRVLKRVQESLDERLSRAVLQVVGQQTALLQSSLELEIDTTIREAVAEAVAKALRADGGAQEPGTQ